MKALLRVIFLAFLLETVEHGVAAQVSPRQQDATRPPGTERRGVSPKDERPNSQGPTAPPGATKPAPDSTYPTPTDLPDPEQVLRGSPLMSELPKPLPSLPDLKRLGVDQ